LGKIDGIGAVRIDLENFPVETVFGSAIGLKQDLIWDLT
jgi:hypothetical protein